MKDERETDYRTFFFFSVHQFQTNKAEAKLGLQSLSLTNTGYFWGGKKTLQDGIFVCVYSV